MTKNYYNDKFHINWANEYNSETLTKEKLNNDKFTIIQVNIKDAFSLAGNSFKLDINSETGGENAISNRLDNAKEYLMSGEPMDYPIVEYNSNLKELSFTNGRHRTLAAAKLGCNYIPMLVFNENLDEFKSNVRTKSMEEPLEQANYTQNQDELNINWINKEEKNSNEFSNFKGNKKVLLQVNIEKAFANMDNYKDEEDLYDKEGRSRELQDEIDKATKSFLNKEEINFPTIKFDNSSYEVNVTSGKANIIAAYELGLKFIPMNVNEAEINAFKMVVETKEMDKKLENVKLKSKFNL